MEMYLNSLIWMQLDLAAHKAPAQIQRDECPAANLWLCASLGAVLKENMIKAHGGSGGCVWTFHIDLGKGNVAR